MLLSRDTTILKVPQLEQIKMEYVAAGVPLAFVALFAVCVYLIRWQPLRRRRGRDPRQAFHRGLIPAGLTNFINDEVVPKLNGQRVKEDQFAVLILSQRSIDNIQETWLRNKFEYHKLVDRSFVSFPDDDDHLVNYIVARPDQSYSSPLHAEKILLNRFDVLKEKFPVSSVSTVLLYSWLMPCSGCTQRIIQKFKHSPYKVVVAYNSDWTKAITEDKNEENRNLLFGAGIDVYQVRYQSTLPSVQSY